MNTSESDLINKTFYPGWLMVSQLRCGQPVTDGEALYRQACRWVTEAREALTAGGVSEASAEQMLYAYCALLDESVLNRASQDDGYRRWRKDPLQARFFSTLNAGEELWERIRQLLREPTADAAVLTCFFRTLQLGFVGQYRAEDDERREDVAQALGARVPPFSLTQEAPVVVRASRLRSGRRNPSRLVSTGRQRGAIAPAGAVPGGGASGAGIAGFRAAGGGTGAPPLRGASGAVAARLAAEYRSVPNLAKRSAAGVERVLGDAARRAGRGKPLVYRHAGEGWSPGAAEGLSLIHI